MEKLLSLGKVVSQLPWFAMDINESLKHDFFNRSYTQNYGMNSGPRFCDEGMRPWEYIFGKFYLTKEMQKEE